LDVVAMQNVADVQATESIVRFGISEVRSTEPDHDCPSNTV